MSRSNVIAALEGLVGAAALYSVLGFVVVELSRVALAFDENRAPVSLTNAIPESLLVLVPAIAVIALLERTRRASGDPKRSKILNLGLVLAGSSIGIFTAGFVWGVAGKAALANEIAKLEAEGLAPPVPSQPKPADAENAAVLLLQAKSSLVASLGKDFTNSVSATELTVVLDRFRNHGIVDAQFETVRPLLETHREALELAAQAADRKSAWWDVAQTPPVMMMPLPDYMPFHTLAKLLALQAIERSRSGDIAGAAASIRTGLALGDALGASPLLFSQLFRAGVTNTVMTVAVNIFDTPEELAVAEAAWAPYLDAHRVIESTKAAYQLDVLLVPREITSGVLGGPANSVGMGGTPAATLFGPFLYFAIRDVLREQRPGLTAASASKPGTKLPADASRYLSRSAIAASRLALARAAIDYSKAPAGSAPATIGNDPFTGGPMAVVASSGSALIFSVGPDRKNDNGANFDKDADTGDLAWLVRPASGVPVLVKTK